MKKKIALRFFISVCLLSLSLLAQAENSKKPTTSNDDEDVQKAHLAEAQAIIDDIKTQNPPDRLKFKAKLGVLQFYANTRDTVGLGTSDGTFPVIAIDGVFNLWGALGFEARETYAQNVVSDPRSGNGTARYMSWLDAGPRYTFFLDSTHLDNNVVLKLLYHDNYNNFNPSDLTSVWVNHYSGISAALERNIPITTKLGILGQFDLIQILSTYSPTTNATDPNTPAVAQSGYGFEIQAEIYYKFQFLNHPSRMGFSYWQQGNQNEMADTYKNQAAKNAYFTVSRALFGTLSVLF